ncbi:MAG: Na/Pi symporter [Pseudomonadota bacterium]
MDLLRQFDSAAFLGGLGLFLFAMSQLEAALRATSATKLRSFLQRRAGSAIQSSMVGALATALVQSSSLVGLMVLAFTGAGVLTLESALGVIFGANFGTTITGWLVATVGFKFDVFGFAYPVIGIGALVFILCSGRVKEAGRLMTAVGLLVLGLDVMKTSVDGLSAVIDLGALSSLAPVQYLLFGILFAAVVQSSSATMLIALTALNAGIIDLPAAAAVAIGADLGTTSTVLIGGIVGPAIKRRAAAAHFIFNLTTAVLAFWFLVPLLALVSLIGLTDPLYSLVAFHSLFNLVGVLLFLPLIRPLAGFLRHRFVVEPHLESRFVSQTVASITEAGLAAVEGEVSYLVQRVIDQNRHVFSPPLDIPGSQEGVTSASSYWAGAFEYGQMYRKNKELEGEILEFVAQIQSQPIERAVTTRLNQLLSAARHAVHAAKSLSDVRHNLDELAQSIDPKLVKYHARFRTALEECYGFINEIGSADSAPVVHDFAEANRLVQSVHDQIHDNIYADIRSNEIRREEISTLLNVNREFLVSNSSLLLALQELGLTETQVTTLAESYVGA